MVCIQLQESEESFSGVRDLAFAVYNLASERDIGALGTKERNDRRRIDEEV